MERDRECGHERNYVTPMGGLEGLYQRCRRCLEYWHWCHNCEGIDPSTCLFNPTLSTPDGQSSETSPETPTTHQKWKTAKSVLPEPPRSSWTSLE